MLLKRNHRRRKDTLFEKQNPQNRFFWKLVYVCYFFKLNCDRLERHSSNTDGDEDENEDKAELHNSRGTHNAMLPKTKKNMIKVKGKTICYSKLVCVLSVWGQEIYFFCVFLFYA